MNNKISKNVKKGSIGGLITIASVVIATVLVDKMKINADNLPVITGAITAIMLGAVDWLKHRKK